MYKCIKWQHKSAPSAKIGITSEEDSNIALKRLTVNPLSWGGGRGGGGEGGVGGERGVA